MNATSKTAKAMRRAWEIRREAAAKFNCRVTEISMSECLKMAWAEIKKEKTTSKKLDVIVTMALIGDKRINKWEKSFIFSNADRINKYEEKTFFSKKQEEIISNLYAKLA